MAWGTQTALRFKDPKVKESFDRIAGFSPRGTEDRYPQIRNLNASERVVIGHELLDECQSAPLKDLLEQATTFETFDQARNVAMQVTAACESRYNELHERLLKPADGKNA